MKINCPFCKSEHILSSSAIRYYICGNCNIAIEPMVDYTIIPPQKLQAFVDDFSDFQLNETITIEGHIYRIIGKIRYHLETTIISKILLVNSQNDIEYLFEFFDTFALAKKNYSEISISKLSNSKAFDEFYINHFDYFYIVKSKFKNQYSNAIGEIENIDEEFSNFEAIELQTSLQDFGFAIIASDKLDLYVGKYINKKAITFSNQKSINKPTNPNVICAKCNGELINNIGRKAFGIVCGKCNGLNVFDEKNKTAIRHVFSKSESIDIPIGSSGQINGITYNVIGFMQKNEKYKTYTWKEYLIKNEADEFAYLSEYNGHYLLLHEIDYFTDISTGTQSFGFEGNTYHLFNQYKINIQCAQGEFPYNLIANRGDRVVEFIAPPYIMVCEKSEDEFRFYKGVSLKQSEVQKAFPGAIIPDQVGIGAAQLMYLGLSNFKFIAINAIFIGIALIMQIIFASQTSEKMVFKEFYDQNNYNDTSKVIVSSSFEIKKDQSAMQIDLQSNVKNNWFGVTIELINHQTGERFEVDKTIEFYSGVDDEGSWSEGSLSENVVLSQVPKGEYHLNLYPEWGNLNKFENSFQIWVYEDVPVWSSFYFIVGIAVLISSIHYIRFRIFESKRWMESNFDSPFITSFE